MKKVFELIQEAKRLIEVGRTDEALTLLDEALTHDKSSGGPVAFDGGSNPPGPGQPGHP